MELSPNQKAVVAARNKNILVAAAAGAGKTAVLSKRIVDRITKDKKNIDEFLVMTFTEAAADEMRHRIIKEIMAAIKSNPNADDYHLRKQLALMPLSNIFTFHAFCQNLLRKYYYLVGLQPDFSVGDPLQMKLLEQTVVKTICSNHYQQTDNAEFLGLMDKYCSDTSDEKLQQMIINIHHFLQSFPYSKLWMDNMVDKIKAQEITDFWATDWGEIVRAQVIALLEEHKYNLSEESTLEEEQTLDEYIAAVKCSWETLQNRFVELYTDKLVTKGKATKDSRGKSFKFEKILNKYLTMDSAGMLAEIRATYSEVSLIAQLVKQFSASYSQAKRERNIVDFNDLEHFSLKLLADEKGRQSLVAAELHQKFVEVMIDEYQDTNDVQNTIIDLLTTKGADRFMVGDVKQSIYRFRKAEPKNFMIKCRDYDIDDSGESVLINLPANYRSRAEVLHGVNYVFRRILATDEQVDCTAGFTDRLTLQPGQIAYGESECLEPGFKYSDKDNNIELILIDHVEDTNTDEQADENGDEDLGAFEKEASLIAERINELISGQEKIYDKNTNQERPVEYRDIAILLRAVKGKADVMLDTLRNQGIPAYAEIDSGFFDAVEIKNLLALLQVLDNPYQDIPLAAVLMSPLVGLAPTEMVELRRDNSSPDRSLWGALKHSVNSSGKSGYAGKTAPFYYKLVEWRSRSKWLGLSALIWEICQQTYYYDYVGAMPKGALRQANIRVLMAQAHTLTAKGGGLNRFLESIKALQDIDSDLGEGKYLSNTENVVRIMTIHKSKGLEFPVVFVADLGKGFNDQDLNGYLLYDKEIGFGPSCIDVETRIRKRTKANEAIRYKIKIENRAEELRVLYVAMTRAREKLILIGSVKHRKDEKKSPFEKWCHLANSKMATLPSYQIGSTKSYLDWLCPVVACHQDGHPILAEAGYKTTFYTRLDDKFEAQTKWKVCIEKASTIKVAKEIPRISRPRIMTLKQHLPVEAEDCSWAAENLAANFPTEKTFYQPAKLTVTALKGILSTPAKVGPTLPSLNAEERISLSAAERGTLLHTVMQLLELQGDLTEAGIASQINGMRNKDRMIQDWCQEIDIAKLAHVFATPIGRRLWKAAQDKTHSVYREMPFKMVLAPQDIREFEAAKLNIQSFVLSGTIDCLFFEGNKAVVIDWKTDQGKTAEQLAAEYSRQLILYEKAVRSIFTKVTSLEKYIYSFALEEAITIE